MAQPELGDVTRLLQSWSGGDQKALGELVPLVYRELRGLAVAYLRRERRDHTLQATALVNEAYLRLVDQTQVQSPSRAQFAIAANLMRQIMGGLTEEEIADVMGVSAITVKRDWRIAKAVLHRQLGSDVLVPAEEP
jgi:DNA-directed RNA polymerase specialized sigma24 family protein